MSNITEFEIFDKFFKKHPGVRFEEILELHEAVRMYQRIGGKTRHDVSNATHTNDVYKIASELEIFRYKDYKVPLLRRMILDKFESVFLYQDSVPCCVTSSITMTEEFFIQAPLTLGAPLELSVNDEHDLTDCLPDHVIDFEEDKNGACIVPKESCVYDFMCATVRECYKSLYRNLKYYKGRYYRYTSGTWVLIESVEEATKELFIVICNNTRTMNNDLEKMYSYIERNDKFKQKLRKILSKNMEKTVKTYSQLDMSNPTTPMHDCIPVAVRVEEDDVTCPIVEESEHALAYDILEEVINELLEGVVEYCNRKSEYVEAQKSLKRRNTSCESGGTHKQMARFFS